MVRIHLAAAQAGEMLSASQHAVPRQPSEKVPGVARDLIRIARDNPGRHHRLRGRCSQVEHRREGGVQPQQAHFLADEAAVLFEQRRLVGGRDRKGRRHGRNQIAQPVDGAPFDIDAAEQR